MRKTIIEKVFEYSQSQPDKIAVMTATDRLTYKQLFDYAYAYSMYLKSFGVKKGDKIVLRANQTAEFPIIYLSIHLCNAVVVSLERSTPDQKMKEISDELGAEFIISDEIGNIPRKNALDDIVVKIDADDNNSPALDDLADILFTTGTTGKSKGVALTHKALVATAENLIIGCEYKEDTVILVPGPLNHANAVRKLFTTFNNGSTIYILNGMMDVKGIFKALSDGRSYGSLACCFPPAAIRMIFSLTKNKIAEFKYDIDFIESASAPLPETDKKTLMELLPFTRLYNNYGSSESASVCMFDYSKHIELKNCIGKPTINAKIIIVDDEKREIASSLDKLGFIASKGDMNMVGYLNDPELTAEVLRDEIVYTNDLGYIDNEGFVYIIGRKGDVLNIGGFKVAPTEVESACLGFNGIKDCVCIGVVNEISGKSLKLLYVSDDEIDPKQFNAFLSGKLENYKIPHLFEKVNEVKRTYNGKIDRKAYQ